MIFSEKPLPGATGVTESSEELIPHWENPREEGHEDEMHEVRKRRLEHFSQQLNTSYSSTTLDSSNSGAELNSDNATQVKGEKKSGEKH